MRRQTPQLSLNCFGIDHDHAKELAQIDLILDDNPRIKELVKQDLFRGLSNPETGRKVPPGYNKVAWDGRSEGGQTVASGIYIHLIQAGRNRQSLKLTIIK